jgi:hypothetical protein
MNKRYTLVTEYDDSWMEESKTGEYVLFEEYKKLYDALNKIHNYPNVESIWDDDRDDAAWDIVTIAGVAIGEINEEE